MRARTHSGRLVAGAALSVGLHALVGALFVAASPEREPDEPANDAIIVDFDIDEPPAPPLAAVPVDEVSPVLVEPIASAAPPVAEPRIEQEPEAIVIVDAGVPVDAKPEALAASEADAGADAGTDAAAVAVADAGPDAGPDVTAVAVADAGPDAGPDATAVAVADAGLDAGPDAAAVVVADVGPDGGAAVAVADAGPDAAGAAAVAVADAGPDVRRLDAGLGAVAAADAVAKTDASEGAPSAKPNPRPEPNPRPQPVAAGAPANTAAGRPAVTSDARDATGEPDSKLPASPFAGGTRRPADADLLGYFPAGHVVAVMLRFDRLRGTEWSKLTESILAPMPDYRTLMGNRKVPIDGPFDTLVIASTDIRDVAATTLVARARVPTSRVRAFIDHNEGPVRWRSARGGALGVRVRTRTMLPTDRRVFLIPMPEWITLARPAHLPGLLAPTRVPLDMASAAPGELPAWLTLITRIEAEAGQRSGPAVMLTIAGMLPDTYSFPYVGELPVPPRLTLALEVDERGFLIRGSMRFGSVDRATAFVAAAERARARFANTRLGRALLSRVHAYHALNGLSLAQNGATLGFATSISISDARAMMAFAAQRTRRFYTAATRRTKPTARPKRARPPAPATRTGPSDEPRQTRTPETSGQRPARPRKPDAAPARPSKPPPSQP